MDKAALHHGGMMSISLLSKVKIKKSKFTGNSNNPKSKIQNPKLPNHPMIVQRQRNRLVGDRRRWG
jgi:hypothetical protein